MKSGITESMVSMVPPKLISGVSIAFDKGYNEGMSQIAIKNQIYSYEKLGNKGETPILILHGWGRSKEEWLNIGRELIRGEKREVYVLDLPGFGGSTLPSQVKSIEEYTELVTKYCQYLDIKKVILINHSLGARVGIVWATGGQRTMIEQLILIDPAGPKEFSLRRWCLSGLATIFWFVPKKVRRALITPLLDEDYRSLPSLRKLYRVVVAEDLRDRLPKVKVPVTLIWGEKDAIVPLRMVRVYRRYLRDVCVRVVWGAGHDPHLSHYPQLLAILQESIE